MFLAALLATCAGLMGCGGGDVPKVQSYEAPVADPLAEAKAILNNYANGMPVTSEAESFPDLVSRVKEKDPAKGATLEKGLAEIKAKPAGAQAKAKELLKQL
jgi:hypothetical protein